MSDAGRRTLLLSCAGMVMIALLLLMRPAYLADYLVLGILIIAELLFLAVVRYKQLFFSVLIGAFLYAGVAFPYRSAFLYARWVVLAVGAAAGLAVYLRDRHHSFGTFHLIAFFCAVSAIVSAVVSAYPGEAILKALSLTLLFIYTMSGGRTAVDIFRPERFFRRLVLACEILTAFTAVSYLIFHWEFFGNPNSLGAVMGVAVIPTMLWGLIVAENTSRRRRLAAALAVAVLVLMSSFARASIAAATLASLFLCIGLRQYKLLIKGIAAAIVLATMAAMFLPQPTEAPLDPSEPITSMFLYKGHAQAGVWGSRRGVWAQTWDVIKQNPWFGSGFGTSLVTADMTKLEFVKHHIDSWVVREHGNSYLAITEWVGLLGVVPFYSLVLLAARNVQSVYAWMRRTGDSYSAAVPAAAIILAGLVHAGFEDWLFAIGYYLSVFFWTVAFILVDVLPRPVQAQALEMPLAVSHPQFENAPAAAVS